MSLKKYGGKEILHLDLVNHLLPLAMAFKDPNAKHK